MDAGKQCNFVLYVLLIYKFKIMRNKLELFAASLSAKQFWLILAISFVAFMGSNVYLGILFENTGYPVPLIEGQLRFSALILMQDFSVLIKNGTLEDYRIIQYLDVSIMISTAIFFGMMTLFVFRNNKNKFWRAFGISLSLLFPLSGLLDLFENIWLLTMLNNPTEFAGWLAFVYSSFALMKLIAFAVGLFGVLIAYILSKLQYNSAN